MRKNLFVVLILLLLVLGLNGIGHASLTDGLVAYYPFNGNANDESGNGNHGVNYGATLTTDRFGNANSAYSFDGVDSYIAIDSIASHLANTGTGTISLWFKGNPDDNSGPLINFDKGNSQHIGYFPLGGWASSLPNSSISYANQTLQFAYSNGIGYYFEDKWHHAAVTVGENSHALIRGWKAIAT